MHRYKIFNGPMPTTGVQVAVTTGTAIKTMLQVATPATRQATILGWGYSCDSPPPGVNSGRVELLQTDVAATVTAHVASGLVKLDPNAPDSLMTLGAAATGYTATAEGAITATRVFDSVNVTGVSNGGENASYEKIFTPAERSIVAISRFLRVRVLFAAAVNMVCWVVTDE